MKKAILTVSLSFFVAMPALAQHSGHSANGHEAQSHEAHIHDAALEAQLDGVREGTARYRDIEAARADGYVRFGKMEGPLMGEHWFRRELTGEPLDLSRPSTLQYAVIDGERVLVGVAYTLYRRPSDPMPEGFVGDADHWHVHDITRIARAATEDRPLLRWIVNRRADRGQLGRFGDRTELTMVHAWVWSDNPDGVFAENHRGLPYQRAGLPAEWAEGASEAAAWGVALLEAGSCDREIQRTDFLGRLKAEQKRALGDACEVSAAIVADALAAGSRERLNNAADHAWASYISQRNRVLSAEQLERMEAMVEHPM